MSDPGEAVYWLDADGNIHRIVDARLVDGVLQVGDTRQHRDITETVSIKITPQHGRGLAPVKTEGGSYVNDPYSPRDGQDND